MTEVKKISAPKKKTNLQFNGATVLKRLHELSLKSKKKFISFVNVEILYEMNLTNYYDINTFHCCLELLIIVQKYHPVYLFFE